MRRKPRLSAGYAGTEESSKGTLTMTRTTFKAEANPDHPGKGERPFCIMRTDEDGQAFKLPRQFNKIETARREAYRIQVIFERRMNRIVYLGD